MIEPKKVFVTPDCFCYEKYHQLCLTFHLKLKPKTLGNYIRGSGVGYPLDMAQGAPIIVNKTYSRGRQTLKKQV